jgi:hypothetical protein
MYYDDEAKRVVPGGTTIRFYNSKIDAWNSVWITPEGNAVVGFIGRKVGSEIVLEGKDPEGTFLKCIFSDIKKDSFTWREEKSNDTGKTWVLSERTQIQRMKVL